MLSNCQDIIEQFNLDAKVRYIITDTSNSANMFKAFVKLSGVSEDSRESESDEKEGEDQDVSWYISETYHLSLSGTQETAGLTLKFFHYTLYISLHAYKA